MAAVQGGSTEATGGGRAEERNNKLTCSGSVFDVDSALSWKLGRMFQEGEERRYQWGKMKRWGNGGGGWEQETWLPVIRTQLWRYPTARSENWAKQKSRAGERGEKMAVGFDAARVPWQTKQWNTRSVFDFYSMPQPLLFPCLPPFFSQVRRFFCLLHFPLLVWDEYQSNAMAARRPAAESHWPPRSPVCSSHHSSSHNPTISPGGGWG